MAAIESQEFGHAYADVVGRLAELPRLYYVTHQRLSDRRYHSDRYPPIPGKYLVTVVLDGAIVYWHGRERRVLRRNQAWLGGYREPGTAYGFDPRCADHLDFLGVIFDGAIAQTLMDRLVGAYGHIFPIDPAHPAVTRLLDIAHLPDHHCRQTATESASVITDLLLALGRAAERAHQEVPDHMNLAQRLEHALRATVHGPLDFAALARRLGVSRSHASRVFRATYGSTPSAYHRGLRMVEACRLLHAGTDSQAALARRLGFASASAFHRAFVREMGVTPERFRHRSGPL